MQLCALGGNTVEKEEYGKPRKRQEFYSLVNCGFRTGFSRGVMDRSAREIP